MVDAAGATVSTSAAAPWKAVTVKANGGSNSTMLHSARLADANTKPSAEAQTTIGVQTDWPYR